MISSRTTLPVRIFVALGIITNATSPANAQLVASERGTVAQTVDGTRITVDYSRPRARGRSPIYGTSMVSWGETWTPGADSATTLEVSRDVHMGGRVIPKGKYSVWTVVRRDSAWTFVLDKQWQHFHTDHPDSNAGQIRFPVKTRAVPNVETLTWSFDSVSSTGTTLTMSWGPIAIDVRIDINPTMPSQISAEAAAPYLGTYSFAWADPATKELPSTFTIERLNGALVGHWAPAQFKTLTEVTLVPLGTGRFAQGFMLRGELASVSASTVWTFTTAGAHTTSFEVRDGGTHVSARGTRR